jgi:SNF2 family DNA or RNA helicase
LARSSIVILISLKAGDVGLNLTAAGTVIHYDPWWNPAVEDQATDRLGTIEEKMEALKAHGQALAAGVLGTEAGRMLALSEDDVEALLAPVSR